MKWVELTDHTEVISEKSTQRFSRLKWQVQFKLQKAYTVVALRKSETSIVNTKDKVDFKFNLHSVDSVSDSQEVTSIMADETVEGIFTILFHKMTLLYS